MNQEEKIDEIKYGNLKKSLLSMGIPTMLGMIITALYYLVDAYFVSGLGHEAFAAVSIVFPIFQVILGIGLTFGSGGGSFISRLLGEENYEKANETASVSVFYSLGITFLFSTTLIIFLEPVLHFIGGTEALMPIAKSYGKIVIFSSYLTVFNVTMNNLVTSEGRSQVTMMIMAMGAVVNIILDPIFIYYFSWGVNGAAFATVVSQGLTTILYLMMILKKKNLLIIHYKYLGKNREILQEIFKIGIPIFFNQLFTSLSMSLTNMAAKPYGEDAIAAMGIMLRVMAIGLYVVFGFTKGFIPVVGINYGAHQMKRMKKAVRITNQWGFIFGIIFGGAMVFGSGAIARAFAPEGPQKLLAIAKRALIYNGIIFVLFAYQNVYASAFLAMGKGKEGGLINLARQGIFFVPLILLFPRIFQLEGVLITQPVADLLTILMTKFYVYKNKNLFQLRNPQESRS